MKQLEIWNLDSDDIVQFYFRCKLFLYFEVRIF